MKLTDSLFKFTCFLCFQDRLSLIILLKILIFQFTPGHSWVLSCLKLPSRTSIPLGCLCGSILIWWCWGLARRIELKAPFSIFLNKNPQERTFSSNSQQSGRVWRESRCWTEESRHNCSRPEVLNWLEMHSWLIFEVGWGKDKWFCWYFELEKISWEWLWRFGLEWIQFWLWKELKVLFFERSVLGDLWVWWLSFWLLWILCYLNLYRYNWWTERYCTSCDSESVSIWCLFFPLSCSWTLATCCLPLLLWSGKDTSCVCYCCFLFFHCFGSLFRPSQLPSLLQSAPGRNAPKSKVFQTSISWN